MPLSSPYSVTRLDRRGRLAEAVDTTFALFVAGGVPREVVVDDGLEGVLEVDALGQAVGRDEDLAWPFAARSRARDARLAFVGGQLPVTTSTVDVLQHGLARCVGDVVGGRDEPAEHDRVESVAQ